MSPTGVILDFRAQLDRATDDAGRRALLERAVGGGFPGLSPTDARLLVLAHANAWSDALTDAVLADPVVWDRLVAGTIPSAFRPFLEAWGVRRVLYNQGARAEGYEAFERLAESRALGADGGAAEAMLRRLPRVSDPVERARLVDLLTPLPLSEAQLLRLARTGRDADLAGRVLRHPHATPAVWAALLESGPGRDILPVLASMPAAMADGRLRMEVLQAGVDGHPDLLRSASPYLDAQTLRQWVVGFADRDPDRSRLALEAFGEAAVRALTVDDWAVLCASSSASLREAALLRVGGVPPLGPALGYQRPRPHLAH